MQKWSSQIRTELPVGSHNLESHNLEVSEVRRPHNDWVGAWSQSSRISPRIIPARQ